MRVGIMRYRREDKIKKSYHEYSGIDCNDMYKQASNRKRIRSYVRGTPFLEESNDNV